MTTVLGTMSWITFFDWLPISVGSSPDDLREAAAKGHPERLFLDMLVKKKNVIKVWTAQKQYRNSTKRRGRSNEDSSWFDSIIPLNVILTAVLLSKRTVSYMIFLEILWKSAIIESVWNWPAMSVSIAVDVTSSSAARIWTLDYLFLLSDDLRSHLVLIWTTRDTSMVRVQSCNVSCSCASGSRTLCVGVCHVAKFAGDVVKEGDTNRISVCELWSCRYVSAKVSAVCLHFLRH